VSQAGGPSEVGKISVGVEANLAGLASSLKQGETMAQASAQKMAAALVVPIGANAAKAAGLRGGPGGGGPSPIPPVPEPVNQSYREASKNVTFLTRSFGQLAGAAGAVVTVGSTIGTVYEYVGNVFGDGKKKADEFYASIGGAAVGGQEARKSLDAIQKKLMEVNSELARLEEKSGASGMSPTLGRSRKTIEEEIERYRELNKVVGQQVRVAEQFAKQKARDEERAKRGPEDFVGPSQAEGQMLEAKVEAQDFMRDLAEEQKRLDRERAEARSQLETDEHRAAMDRARDIGDAADPLGGSIRRHRDELAELDRAERLARNEEERRLIKFYREDVVKAFIQGLKENQIAIGDVLNAALAASNSSEFGAQNMTSLLSDISVKMSAIQASIPRGP
jgi:hypothetical protein